MQSRTKTHDLNGMYCTAFIEFKADIHLHVSVISK